MAFDANDLSPHEHFVVERTRAGEIADFSPMGGADGSKPSVRAGFLRKLLLGLDPSWAVPGPGVRLKGARIEGALDLTDCSGAALPALSLDGRDIPEPIDISRAQLTRLALVECRLRGLVGADARIAGDVSLARTAPHGAPGAETLTLSLAGAHIGGDLRLSGAKAAATDAGDRIAVRFDGAQIGGDVLMDEGFEAFGAVTLSGAAIRGALRGDGAQWLNRSDDARNAALVAHGARFGGDVRLGAAKAEGALDFSGAHVAGDIDLAQSVLRNEFGAALTLTNARIAGEVSGAGKLFGLVSLRGAEIGRNLDLRGAEIANPTTPRADSFGVAIDAAGMAVGGAALLQGANVKGEVFLADARIAGYLAFGGGRFINGGGWAIRAPNLRVGGNLTLKIDETGFAPHGQKTVIEGGAKFDRAQIEGALAWLNLELRGPAPDGAKGGLFSFADARIAGPLQARGFVSQQEARIDASGASCGALDDDIKTGWGVDTATLALDGFTFARIEASGERWRDRLAWLKRAVRERMSPQPFTQVAQTYARAGRREDARRIQLAEHDMRTLRASSGPITWLFSSLFGLIAGYGLAPIRVLRALALFIALGVAGVLTMNAQGALVTPRGQACNGAVEPALYAIDVALPVVDLGQASRCAPGRTARADLPAGMPLGESDWRLFEGAALWKWAHGLYAILGAILAALTVITFSGVLKPRE